MKRQTFLAFSFVGLFILSVHFVFIPTGMAYPFDSGVSIANDYMKLEKMIMNSELGQVTQIQGFTNVSDFQLTVCTDICRPITEYSIHTVQSGQNPQYDSNLTISVMGLQLWYETCNGGVIVAKSPTGNTIYFSGNIEPHACDAANPEDKRGSAGIG